jgi:hypothetical protein
MEEVMALEVAQEEGEEEGELVKDNGIRSW